MKLFILGLAATLGVSSIASADCGDDAANVVGKKGFTVRDTGVEELYEPQNTNLVSYRVWLRVAQCSKGYVIVNMRDTCLIKDIWSQNGCDVPVVRQALRSQD